MAETMEKQAGASRRTACAYVRTSLGAQAACQSAIDSQTAAIERWSRANGVGLVDVYVERGSDDSQFAAMLDNATAADRPYDIVVVHTLSRLSRDLSTLIVSCQRLDRAGVELVSITEGEFEAVDRIGAAMTNGALKGK